MSVLCRPVRLDDFDFPLPDSAIATEPANPRDSSRLLVPGATGLAHHRFRELGDFLRAGDLLVLNDTKVLAARLFGQNGGGRRFEVFLLAPRDPSKLRWRALAKPGKKLGAQSRLFFPGGVFADVTRDGDEFLVDFGGVDGPEFLPWLERNGLPPLPPYIRRPASDADRERYQTVYARESGSIAAPTAGLHFTAELLAELERRGIERAQVTLHVGYGTFAPIRSETLDTHVMHEETYSIPEATVRRLEAAKAEGRRVIAIGTTSLRTLESWPELGPTAATSLFIRPGYRFRVVDGLVTNFHLPKSSLFVLVCALLGTDEAKAAYAEALAQGYRFYSYGDAMAILP